MFGFLVIVIAPIIMTLIVTTIQIYTEVFHKIESVDRSKTSKKPGLISRIKAKAKI